MGSILSPAPLDLVNLLFYLEGFQVIEFGFMGLEFGMEFVFASFFLASPTSVSVLGVYGVYNLGDKLIYRFVPLE
jgi:hypothetical protein